MSAGLKDILAIPPTNAWLLIGDEASFPSQSDLRDNRRRPLQDDAVNAEPNLTPFCRSNIDPSLV